MKRSKLLPASIRIRLASLLSVASGGSDEILRSQTKDQQQPEQEGNKSSDDSQIGTPINRAVIEIPESIFQEYRANQQAQSRDTKRYHSLTKLAVLGAWVYATIAGAQLYSSERPYIGMLSSQMKAWDADKPVDAVSVVENVGRTTATHVFTRNGIYVANKGESINWKGIEPREGWSAIFHKQMSILPGTPYSLPAKSANLSADQKKQVTDGSKVLVMITAVDYLDQFFIAHRVRSCEIFTPRTNAFLFCQDDRKAE
jgi:hypothetical protein